MFEETEDPSDRSFFSEIISSISDVKFSNSGDLMISRDYLTVKVWDLRKENQPIESYSVSFFLHLKKSVGLKVIIIFIYHKIFIEFWIWFPNKIYCKVIQFLKILFMFCMIFLLSLQEDSIYLFRFFHFC